MGAGDNKKVCCEAATLAATAPKIPRSKKLQHPTIGETDVFPPGSNYSLDEDISAPKGTSRFQIFEKMLFLMFPDIYGKPEMLLL